MLLHKLQPLLDEYISVSMNELIAVLEHGTLMLSRMSDGSAEESVMTMQLSIYSYIDYRFYLVFQDRKSVV